MTLEGCVVRISDVIAYIGKDIEDAIRLNKISIDDIPQNILKTLGKNNSEIVNTIVTDIINNSFNHNYIKISENIFNALSELIEFNSKNIYKKANTKEQIDEYTKKFNKLFDLYYEHLSNNKKDSDIFNLFIDNMDKDYIENTSNARKVIDFIAGMTDDFLQLQYDKYFK